MSISRLTDINIHLPWSVSSFPACHLHTDCQQFLCNASVPPSPILGPLDRFGVTQEVHQARVAHADQYTTFVRAKRTAAARKYLTQAEGGADDINIGMKPYR